MTNRQLAAARTKARLTETAKRLICEKGLDTLSVEEITEACGVAKGTFYTYFKRKEDIVYQLSREAFGEILAAAKNFPGNITERLKNYMVNFSGYIEKSSLHLCQAWVRDVVVSQTADGACDKGKLRQDVAAVTDLLRSGVADGELLPDTPVDALAGTVVDLLYGQMLCWCLSDGAYGFEARTRAFCDTYLDGWLGRYIKQTP